MCVFKTPCRPASPTQDLTAITDGHPSQSEVFVEAFFNSFLLVAATEMGDKTQLLALILATRFRQPGAVMLGILVATILNHLLAVLFGVWVSGLVSPETLKWILAAVFFGFAIWVLIPDRADEGLVTPKWGAFGTTLVAFFLAEMGDKTQLSTVALSAQFQNLPSVLLGSTLGMIFSDGLAVFFGEKLLRRISMRSVRLFSAGLFVLLGVLILVRG